VPGAGVVRQRGEGVAIVLSLVMELGWKELKELVYLAPQV
jgi:hypothetical protein